MKKSANFETSLSQLERIVREMEQGDLPLEKSLELFEQGVRLSRECQERLNEAERRIEMLLRDAEGRPLVTKAGGLHVVETGIEDGEDDDLDDDDESSDDNDKIYF